MTCLHQGKRFVRRWIPIAHGLVPPNIEAETDICADCMEWFALGPSNDRIPPHELNLAAQIADIERLWEPGKSREEMIALAVDEAAERIR